MDPSGAALHRSLAPDLTPSTLYALLRLRVTVFVVEQACPYPELDGRDLEPTTRHYWIGDPEPLAYLRLLEDGPGRFRIGRVCAARNARGRGYGRRLLEAALAEVGDDDCELAAQRHLTALYAGFGFQVSGAEFDEDGILHVPMRLHP